MGYICLTPYPVERKRVISLDGCESAAQLRHNFVKIRQRGMYTASSQPKITPFGPFEADLLTQELRKNGTRLRLPNQSFLVLSVLLERPGELVTRDELHARLWPADTFCGIRCPPVPLDCWLP